MTVVILTIHVLIVLGLIVVVLMQRSEGGALGMGAGSGGGFMSGRSAANALTRTTSVLAGLFFATSLGLAIFAGAGESEDSAIEALTGSGDPTVAEDVLNEPAAPTASDILESLGNDADSDDSAPGADNAAAVAPLSEQEILNALGAEAGQSVGSGEAAPQESSDGPAETEEPPQ